MNQKATVVKLWSVAYSMEEKITIDTLISKKKTGLPIIMLTAYDYSTASIIDEVGVDIVLVGDSLANVILGLESTKEVTMAEMLHHTKAVRRAVKKAMLVGDMPFESYQVKPDDAVKNARRFIEEAGCDAVKVEWFDRCTYVIENIIKSTGIAVMGHIGLTPQTADRLGGFTVQGKDAKRAEELIEQALLLEKIGVFSIVLECIPEAVAKIITERLGIPTIGIGSGVYCDGQVLVTNDMLGLFEKYKPKFVKRYANLSEQTRKALELYKFEVEKRIFPSKEYSYGMKEGEAEKLKAQIGKVKG